MQYYENTIYTLDPLALSLSVVKSHYCWDSKKSLQMPLITSETIGSNPVNSLVKKACDSFGLEAISFRSSRGAQATPTEKMVIPAMEVFLNELKSGPAYIKNDVHMFFSCIST